jgi:hypothetical protein
VSFFDDVDDEPRTAQRRPQPRSRRSSGGGRRPPTDAQAIQIRRAVAAVVIIVVLVLIILGVHSCEVSSRNSALRDYNNSVNSLIQRSNQTGAQFFSQLSGAGGASNATTLQENLNTTAAAARSELKDAQNLDVPGQVSTAQKNLLFALQMRVDGIANIATQVQPALNSSTSKAAVSKIAAEMARFYASDVIYIDYTEPEIAAALNSALGSNNGATYNGGQFFPNLGWLTPDYVASKIGATVPTPPNAKCVSGQLVGNELNYVSVGGNQLQSGSSATVAASPAPTFSLNVTNGGQTNLSGVQLKVQVVGTSVKGTGTLSSIASQATASGNVTLSSTPPTGTYNVTATVVPVHCETNTSNNSLTFSITFQ